MLVNFQTARNWLNRTKIHKAISDVVPLLMISQLEHWHLTLEELFNWLNLTVKLYPQFASKAAI